MREEEIKETTPEEILAEYQGVVPEIQDEGDNLETVEEVEEREEA